MAKGRENRGATGENSSASGNSKLGGRGRSQRAQLLLSSSGEGSAVGRKQGIGDRIRGQRNEEEEGERLGFRVFGSCELGVLPEAGTGGRELGQLGLRTRVSPLLRQSGAGTRVTLRLSSKTREEDSVCREWFWLQITEKSTQELVFLFFFLFK